MNNKIYDNNENYNDNNSVVVDDYGYGDCSDNDKHDNYDDAVDDDDGNDDDDDDDVHFNESNIYDCDNDNSNRIVY